MMMSLHGSQSPRCILAFDLDREISAPAPASSSLSCSTAPSREGRVLSRPRGGCVAISFHPCRSPSQH